MEPASWDTMQQDCHVPFRFKALLLGWTPRLMQGFGSSRTAEKPALLNSRDYLSILLAFSDRTFQPCSLMVYYI